MQGGSGADADDEFMDDDNSNLSLTGKKISREIQLVSDVLYELARHAFTTQSQHTSDSAPPLSDVILPPGPVTIHWAHDERDRDPLDIGQCTPFFSGSQHENPILGLFGSSLAACCAETARSFQVFDKSGSQLLTSLSALFVSFVNFRRTCLRLILSNTTFGEAEKRAKTSETTPQQHQENATQPIKPISIGRNVISALQVKHRIEELDTALVNMLGEERALSIANRSDSTSLPELEGLIAELIGIPIPSISSSPLPSVASSSLTNSKSFHVSPGVGVGLGLLASQCRVEIELMLHNSKQLQQEARALTHAGITKFAVVKKTSPQRQRQDHSAFAEALKDIRTDIKNDQQRQYQHQQPQHHRHNGNEINSEKNGEREEKEKGEKGGKHLGDPTGFVLRDTTYVAQNRKVINRPEVPIVDRKTTARLAKPLHVQEEEDAKARTGAELLHAIKSNDFSFSSRERLSIVTEYLAVLNKRAGK